MRPNSRADEPLQVFFWKSLGNRVDLAGCEPGRSFGKSFENLMKGDDE